ncbi:MAG: hypothetical protein IJD14_01150 [Christensenellaceae bacterium]|nr:hypothetical protein [Christensenellaceae bacterium]
MNNDLIKKRFSELAERAFEKQIYTYTDFLSMDEISVFLSMRNKLSHVPYTLSGGMKNAERQILCFGSKELCGYEHQMPISILKAEPLNKKFSQKLSHRDFLGALTGLGIDRSALGDIIVNDNTAYIFCLENMSEFLTQNFSQVKHTNICCSITDELPKDVLVSLKDITVQVSSLRTDALIAHVFHLSRGTSSRLFQNELVYINSVLCQNPSRKPEEGDIISVRRMGRFIFNSVTGTTKKGKLNVSVSLYE